MAAFQLQFARLEQDSQEDIYIMINSKGATFNAAQKIYQIIAESRVKTIGVVISCAFSAAALILQACTERQACPWAKILIHHLYSEVGITLGPHADTADLMSHLKADISNIITDNDAQVKIFAAKSSLKEEALIALMKRNEILTADQALDIGLIDKILICS
jgi:ATP-dependent protease ClpP protease subunit